MILNNREPVIENIKNAVNNGDFDAKVELNDPVLTVEEKQATINRYIKLSDGMFYFINNRIARGITSIATKEQYKTTKIIGMENIKDIKTGAIITSNHFNPLDNVAIRKLAIESGRKRIHIIGQENNLAMKGLFGYLMNSMDVIPISTLPSYMKKDFPDIIKKKLDNNQFVLIYPEQEMWYNYKKPRPGKPGAYYFASKFNVPIISCFVEMREQTEKEAPNFYKVYYTLHILPPIYPDPNKTVKENTNEMMAKDYAQKKEAYEKVYEEELTYDFKPEDIAGWREA